jgi:predicted metal-dependent HD superfamily phosphohydrolase
MSLDKQRWKNLIKIISGKYPDDDTFTSLIDAYSQSHRYYHNATHVENCLIEFDISSMLAGHPDEVELAIWLHDLFYDPKAKDNEEKSASFASSLLAESGCNYDICNRVKALILATMHNCVPESADAELLVDIDLSILGQQPEIYDIYEKNIRAEYSWVPIEAYIEGRTKVLQSFLDQPRIYLTDIFEKKYEKQARLNMGRAILNLKK